jgi:CTP synthase
MPVKYIFVTGGVVSGLGKGITAASLGRLLKERDLRVTIQKFDPYINVDPGTMSPYQHGEVFVTDDGAEADLDLGHYERFIDENLNKNSNVTTGKIYWSIINKERKGEFLGATVQVIPHVTNAIKERIYRVGKSDSTDIVITEIGGTVGDIESLPFLEAIRQVSTDVGRENVMYIHVTLLPHLGKSGEPKTKPTQHSVKELRSIGIQPDIIVCRTEKPISDELKEKLALFCNLPKENVIQNLDVEVLYEVPLKFEELGLADIVCKRLSIECQKPDLSGWTLMVEQQKNLKSDLKIAIVGKYVELQDAYISVVESLKHAANANGHDVDIKWVNSELLLEGNVEEDLSGVHGILVPGGFGERGIEGKVLAVKFARERKIPFFGICLGMQVAVIEFARNIAELVDANSSEFFEGLRFPVIDMMPEQKDVDEKGGTMRLGLYPCKLEENTIARDLYDAELVYERHRHRYEFNNEYRELLLSKGLILSGLSPCGKLVEIIELEDHPWFVGVQFHPEFKSRPNKPHPIFQGFIDASIEQMGNKFEQF